MNISISGNVRGQTVFFLAGWPDTADVFRDNLMRSMEHTYRLVGLTLPGYADSTPFIRHYCSRQAEPTATRTDEHTNSGHDATIGGVLRRRPPQLARLPCGGYRFDQLVDLLALAVDTAMRTHNYAPDVLAPPAPAQASSQTTGEDTHGTSSALPAHRVPPQYTRPIFIAHDWGCCLLFELLLRRPHFFSRVVALDVAPSLFDCPDGYFAAASAACLREQQQQQQQYQSTETHQNSTAQDGLVKGDVGSNRPHASHTSTVTTATTTAVSTPAGYRLNPPFPVQSVSSSRHGLDDDGKVGAVGLGSSTRLVSEKRAARRRTLASRYAMRAASTRPVAWKQDAPGRVVQWFQFFLIVLYQVTLIVLYAFVPTIVSRLLVRVVASVFARPNYTHDPRLVVTAETEALNDRVRAAAYQGAAYHDRRSDTASPLTAFMLGESLQTGQWQILLLPFSVPKPENRLGDRGSACGEGGSSSLLCDVASTVAYQAYYFPPSARANDEKVSSAGASGTGSGSRFGVGVRSQPSRAAALRAQAEIVQPQPNMGYVYYRYWIGVLLSCLFSSSSAPATPTKTTVVSSDGVCSVDSEWKALLDRRHGHSPLISQRYNIPIHVPILYMYGAHKPFMFHSRQFCAYVEYCKRAEDGISGVVEIKDGGHWFFADPRFRSEVAEHVWDFCQAPVASLPT